VLTDFLMHPSGRDCFHITHHVFEARGGNTRNPVLGAEYDVVME
jgi:hypothetical protein